MWRKFAAPVFILLGALALHRFVYVPFACNAMKGDAKRSFDRARETGDSFQMRVAALRNIPSLEECRKKQPRDVELATMFGEQLVAAERVHAARDVYCGALAFAPTAEMHLACADASIAVGDRATALEHLLVVGEYSGPRALANVADAQLRWEATRRAGVVFEKNAIARGELDLRNLVTNSSFAPVRGSEPNESPAEAWFFYPNRRAASATLLPARGRNGNAALAVETTTARTGVRHVLVRSSRKPRVIATAWVFVERGTVCFGASDARSLLTNVCSTKTGVWEKLESVNESCPAIAISLLAGSEDGARFLVDEVTARETLAAPLCER